MDNVVYSTDYDQLASFIREQMMLWSTSRVRVRRQPLLKQQAYEERLSSLLSQDLSFEGENTSYSRHNFHAFAAKFPPQLPAFFIENLTSEGEVVLDPMMGSGTALLEAELLGRRAVGFDIDPLAWRVSFIKTVHLSKEKAAQAAARVIEKTRRAMEAPEALREKLPRKFSPETLDFMNYWFLPSTQLELLALSEAISSVEDSSVRVFLEVAFSAIIVTKSGGVTMARDLAHSRPHRVQDKTPKNAIDQFAKRVSKNLDSLTEALPENAVRIYRADARRMPLDDETIDLIVTSPPYANAIDYMRAHKFSLVWLGEPIPKLSGLRSTYIGTEKTGREPAESFGPVSEKILSELSRTDEKKRRVMSRYLRDMSQVYREMLRVLRPGRCAVIVVGSSTMHGLDVRTQDCLAEAAKSVGWNVIGMAPRTISRNKRMMPMRRGSSGSSLIEQRMSQEFVIGMVKPA